VAERNNVINGFEFPKEFPELILRREGTITSCGLNELAQSGDGGKSSNRTSPCPLVLNRDGTSATSRSGGVVVTPRGLTRSWR
jgi:hypothetical protein